MEIRDFDSLLAAARAQAQPQRVLMVFAHAALHDDHSPAEADRYARGEGGILLPMMCLDRPAAEMTDFAALAAEAAGMAQPWQVMFVACLGGDKGVVPSAAEAEASLKRMIQTIQTGGDVARYLAFDREGRPLLFG